MLWHVYVHFGSNNDMIKTQMACYVLVAEEATRSCHRQNIPSKMKTSPNIVFNILHPVAYLIRNLVCSFEFEPPSGVTYIRFGYDKRT